MPVPWVLVGLDRVWAWDPTAGLLELTDLGIDLDNFADWACLSADGRLLTYESRTRGRGPKNDQRATYHLESGERTTEALTEGFVFEGVDGVRLRVRYPNWVNGDFQNNQYVLERGGELHELALTDHVGYNFTGPTAQFSSAGDELAVGHASRGMSDQWVSITNLRTESTARFEGFGLASCGAWSPSAARLLVMRGATSTEVLTRATKEVRSLEPTLEVFRKQHGWDLKVSGWLDDSHVLVNQIAGRRLLVWVLNVDSGDQHPLLDLPMPTSRMDFSGLRMAPAVVQANPALAGFLGN